MRPIHHAHHVGSHVSSGKHLISGIELRRHATEFHIVRFCLKPLIDMRLKAVTMWTGITEYLDHFNLARSCLSSDHRFDQCVVLTRRIALLLRKNRQHRDGHDGQQRRQQHRDCRFVHSLCSLKIHCLFVITHQCGTDSGCCSSALRCIIAGLFAHACHTFLAGSCLLLQFHDQSGSRLR
jgi:hypothetical protein